MSSESFERLGARRGIWDVSMDCDDPIPVTLHSRATGQFKNWTKDGVKRVPGIELTLLTACRRCPVCLLKKSRLWAYRALTEIDKSERTWFGTLTTNPETDVWIDANAGTRKRDFWLQPEGKKFDQRAQVMGIEVTKFLKRIRKNCGVPFRYLLVTEEHNSRETGSLKRSRPHCHLLIHEFPGRPLRKTILETSWNHGYSQWRLTTGERRVAWYVSKYISKAMNARVRASLGYGGMSDEDCAFMS